MNRSHSRSSSAQSKSKTGQRRSQSTQPKGRSAVKKKSAAQPRRKSAQVGRKITQSRSKTSLSRTKVGTKTKTAARTSTKTGARGASGASRTISKRGGPGAQAIGLLMDDHRKVQKLFKQAQRQRGDTARLRETVEQGCAALSQHAEIEEQYLYPELRSAAKDRSMVAEAEVEHASAKQLIAELEGMSPDDEQYAATFKVLGEYVSHHIKEEESKIFPAAKKAQIDWNPLLEALTTRKTHGASARSAQATRSARAQSGGAGARDQRDLQDGTEEADEVDTSAPSSEEDIEQLRRSRGRGGAGSTGGVGSELEEPRGGLDEGTDETEPRTPR